MTSRDSVPLGVSGIATVPLKRYVGSVGREPGREAVLIDEPARVAYVAKRLSEAFDCPLTFPGSPGLARAVLSRFHDVDLLPAFAEKVIETLRDGRSHNRTAVSSDDPRRGHYFQPLVATAGRIGQAGFRLAGFLEIDAYVREDRKSTRLNSSHRL